MTEYVTCPICGEHDMPKEPVPDEPGRGYIRCTNLECGSNGGSNFSALSRRCKSRIRLAILDTIMALSR